MYGVFMSDKGSCRTGPVFTEGEKAADAFGRGDEVMDVTSGYVISGIVKNSATALRERTFSFRSVRKKFLRESLQNYGVARLCVIHLHIYFIIT
jgi:hypothetical protein